MVWPLLPMSIVLGGTRDVSSVVFDERYPFAPFDPRHAEQLPDLSRFGVTYTGLKAALDHSAHRGLSSGRQQSGVSRRGLVGEGGRVGALDGWSARDAAARDSSAGNERGGHLEMTLSAFVSPRHPRQRVTVSLNGRQLGVLELTAAQVANGPATINLPVPSGVDACGDDLLLQLDLPDAQSPKSLGLSDDFRRLGIAMIELRLVPNS